MGSAVCWPELAHSKDQLGLPGVFMRTHAVFTAERKNDEIFLVSTYFIFIVPAIVRLVCTLNDAVKRYGLCLLVDIGF